MRGRLMLGMMPGMFGSLCLGQPTDEQNAGNKRDGEKFPECYMPHANASMSCMKKTEAHVTESYKCTEILQQ